MPFLTYATFGPKNTVSYLDRGHIFEGFDEVFFINGASASFFAFEKKNMLTFDMTATWRWAWGFVSPHLCSLLWWLSWVSWRSSRPSFCHWGELWMRKRRRTGPHLLSLYPQNSYLCQREKRKEDRPGNQWLNSGIWSWLCEFPVATEASPTTHRHINTLWGQDFLGIKRIHRHSLISNPAHLRLCEMSSGPPKVSPRSAWMFPVNLCPSIWL